MAHTQRCLGTLYVERSPLSRARSSSASMAASPRGTTVAMHELAVAFGGDAGHVRLDLDQERRRQMPFRHQRGERALRHDGLPRGVVRRRPAAEGIAVIEGHAAVGRPGCRERIAVAGFARAEPAQPRLVHRVRLDEVEARVGPDGLGLQRPAAVGGADVDHGPDLKPARGNPAERRGRAERMCDEVLPNLRMAQRALREPLHGRRAGPPATRAALLRGPE